jgi:hypothetical protein
MLQQLPAEVQKAQQQQLQPRRGVPLATAHRARQLSGPRVSLQRYSLADQWERSLKEFWQGPQPDSSSSSAALSTHQQQQQQHLDADSSGSSGTEASASAAVSDAGGSSAGAAAPGSKQLRGVAPQDRPIVAVVTAAGAIMQAGSGGPESGQVVESHKLVRVLRGYRENSQVCFDRCCGRLLRLDAVRRSLTPRQQLLLCMTLLELAAGCQR